MKAFSFQAVALLLAVTGALAQNFVGSCDASSIKVTGSTITANCKNILGQSKCSKLDLNNCIKNNSGALQEDPVGVGPHFGSQCIECTIKLSNSGSVIGNDPPSAALHCKCNPGTGVAQVNWPAAKLDLNNVVDNNNGMLECYKTKGTAC